MDSTVEALARLGRFARAVEGRLRIVADHRIDATNLGYHRKFWRLG
jgi:hypothetical protein